MTLNELFPEVNTFDEGRLKVSALHELYYEQSGNPHGTPIIFLHGGPGGGTSPKQRRFFDPEFYRIILFDQRGAGKSSPRGELSENDTWELVSDMEKLREHLQIDRWVLFGGSWGSTLALSYAVKHSDTAMGMILRGIFLCRKSEIEWFYEAGGAHQLFPEEWEKYRAQIPGVEPGKMVEAYYQQLTGSDEKTKLEAAIAWSRWEGATSKLEKDQNVIDNYANPNFALTFARIECHYFVHNTFMPSQEYLLSEIEKLRPIPTRIVQGRYDIVCPMKTAWEVKNALQLSDAEFKVVTAGHLPSEQPIQHELVQATQDFKKYF